MCDFLKHRLKEHMDIDSLKGLFISLEGGEGAGKSSLLLHLESWLIEQGYSVVVTREPGGTGLSETIRSWLLNNKGSFKIGDRSELLLFLAARAQHIQELILPALQNGKVVLCDRFNDSTIAYQGAARNLGIEYVKNLCQLVCGSVQPQLTFLLDVAPEVGLERSRLLQKETSAGELDRIEAESLAFHQKIRDAFMLLAAEDPLRFSVIDAHRQQEEVQRKAIVRLEKFISPFKKQQLTMNGNIY